MFCSLQDIYDMKSLAAFFIHSSFACVEFVEPIGRLYVNTRKIRFITETSKLLDDSFIRQLAMAHIESILQLNIRWVAKNWRTAVICWLVFSIYLALSSVF